MLLGLGGAAGPGRTCWVTKAATESAQGVEAARRRSMAEGVLATRAAQRGRAPLTGPGPLPLEFPPSSLLSERPGFHCHLLQEGPRPPPFPRRVVYYKVMIREVLWAVNCREQGPAPPGGSPSTCHFSTADLGGLCHHQPREQAVLSCITDQGAEVREEALPMLPNCHRCAGWAGAGEYGSAQGEHRAGRV